MKFLMAPLVASSCPKSMANTMPRQRRKPPIVSCGRGRAWRMLATLAEQVLDLAKETLR